MAWRRRRQLSPGPPALATSLGGEWLRATRGGSHFADIRTVRELAGLGIDLADLLEFRPLR
jgi:hypothetical protein